MEQALSTTPAEEIRVHPFPVRRVAVRERRGPGVNLLLFGLTFLTTAMASSLNQGENIFTDPLAIRHGLPFAVAIMGILLCHEMGHYLFARSYGVDATLPFFIPAPPIFLLGTFGAFIRMRTLPPTRRALFDIGAAGPWAGFLVSILAVVVGLRMSEIRPLDTSMGGLMLGDSLLFSWLTHLTLGVSAEDVTILLHPVALAGWFGFLVTCLNLLPIGQLDGGHVAYSVFGRHHRWVSRGTLAFLVVLGFGGWPGWLVWAFLLVFLGLDHPVPQNPYIPLGRRRMVAAALTALVFALTFMPVPFEFTEPMPPPLFEGERIPISVPAAPQPAPPVPL